MGRSQTGLGQNELSVRVLPKMRIDLPLQNLDLLIKRPHQEALSS
jgi:hypothetical protein